MGITERRAREKDELRRKILDAAAAMFVDEGYENVSMRKIAERIEYAPSTIYLYFKDKVEMVAAICFEMFGELDARLEAIHELRLPPIETLRRSLRAYIDFGLENPSAYGFVFCVPPSMFRNFDEETHNAILNVGVGTFGRLVEGMRLCMESGCIAPGDPMLKAQASWLCIHGVVAGLIYNCGFPFVDKDLLIEHSLDRIIGSLI
jgi:AcrR family transcriptional regulator